MRLRSVALALISSIVGCGPTTAMAPAPGGSFETPDASAGGSGGSSSTGGGHAGAAGAGGVGGSGGNNVSAEAFVTVHARSTCSQAVVAQCPADYTLVGGGIEFADAYSKCGPSLVAEPIASELFVHALSSYPLDPSAGNGWY